MPNYRSKPVSRPSIPKGAWMDGQLRVVCYRLANIGLMKEKIHEAIEEGDIEAVKQQLAEGADVNAGPEKITPLHYAAQGGEMEIVELLISKGADVNAKNYERKTPLDSAILFAPQRGHPKHTKIADLLRKHGGKHGTIYGAADGGDIEGVKEFLAAGADVNAKNYLGRTPLYWATNTTAGGHKEIVELLIAKGADVNAKTIDGVTPLHNAAEWGHKEVGEILIAEGADVNAKNNLGDTPLDCAINYDDHETADFLRKHGGKTGEELKAAGK
jgi:ankyrin repeat protein